MRFIHETNVHQGRWTPSHLRMRGAGGDFELLICMCSDALPTQYI